MPGLSRAWRAGLVGVLCAALLALSGRLHAANLPELLMPPLAIDADGDRNVFASPFDYRAGRLFTVHVEPPAPGSRDDGMHLRSVVRMGVQDHQGRWSWQASTLSGDTLRDPYHNAASLALDRDGYVHVAYNMHNMPWQYSVSTRPYAISQFRFRGQAVNVADLRRVTLENRINFPEVGSAAIAGNQVSYPMFFSDRNGELYVTYRYALRPQREWSRRAFAGGLARYDCAARRWVSLGGDVPIVPGDALLAGAPGYLQHPFAFDEQFTVYLITLAFDNDNGMHIVWNWRRGGAGLETEKPSYAYSPDGGQHFYHADQHTPYVLPITYAAADAVVDPPEQFYAQKSLAASLSHLASVILQPLHSPRRVYAQTASQPQVSAWNDDGAAPFSATALVEDRNGAQWAVASGLRIFTRAQHASAWTQVLDMAQGLGYPWLKYVAEENTLYIHAKSRDGSLAMIYRYRLP